MNEQRKRAVGAVMTYVEREVYPHLDERQRRDLRNRILAAISQYHDTAIDVLKASIDDGSLVNKDALDALARMDANLALLRRDLQRESG
jgi:hypothetical protein